MPAVNTIADLVRARAGDARVGLRFEDSSWTYAELVDRLRATGRVPARAPAGRRAVPRRRAARQRARVLDAARRGRAQRRDAGRDQPDPPRRRAGARRAAHRLRAARDRVGAPRPARRRGRRACPRDSIFVVDTPEWDAALAPHAGAPLPDVEVAPGRHVHADLHVGHHRRAEGRAHEPRQAHAAGASNLAGRFPLTPDDVCYSAMPLFHSNAAVAGYTAPIAAGATTVLRRRFSASGLPPRRAQVRRDVLQLRRQAAHVHPRDARAARRRRHHAAHRVRQRGRAARHRPLRAALRLLRRRRLRLDRGRHQHVEDRRHAARFARRADSRLPRRDRRSRHRRSSARARSSTSTAGCSTPRRRSARS